MAEPTKVYRSPKTGKTYRFPGDTSIEEMQRAIDSSEEPQGAERFLEAVKGEVNPMLQFLGTAARAATGSLPDRAAIPGQLLDMVRGIGGGMLSQEQKGIEAMRQGNVGYGLNRFLTGSIPVVGPWAWDVTDAFQRGDPAVGGAKLGVGLAQVALPEALGAITDPLRSLVAPRLYAAGARKSMPAPEGPSPLQYTRDPATGQVTGASNPIFENYQAGQGRAFQSGITFKREPYVGPEYAKLQRGIETRERLVDQLVKDYDTGVPGVNPPGPLMKATEGIQPVLDAIDNIYKAGNPSQASTLERLGTEYLEEHTGIPRVRPGTTTPGETFGDYVKRLQIQDPGKSLEYWQGIKRAKQKKLPESTAVKSTGELQEGTSSDAVFNGLVTTGLRREIAKRAPVGQLNQEIAQSIQLQKALQDYAVKDPERLMKIASVVAGAGTMAGMQALGIHFGQVPLEYLAGPTAAWFLAPYIVRLAMRDPGAMTRLGVAMKEFGVNLPTVTRPGAIGGLTISQSTPEERAGRIGR